MRPRVPVLTRALLLSATVAAGARQVDVPITFDHDFIRQTLLAQVYTAADGQAVLWDDSTGCRFLKLREPDVSSANERLRVVTRGEARVGVRVGETCLAPLHWDGFIEIFEEPQVTADQRAVQFRVVDSNIYDSNWKKRFATGKLWDLVKQYVQPRFEAVRIDLAAPVDDLRSLLPLMVARGDPARVEQLLDSLHLADARASATGVTLTLAFTTSAATPAPAPTPEPTLTADELRRWEESWQRWDAFLTFVVKQFGHDTTAKDLRQALADVLVEARYDILEALTPSAPGAPDPTRALFLKTWERLAPVVRRSASTLPGATALRYMSFIAAGDALTALDQMGPDVGLDISADGLRRLARIVAPLSTEDPLAYSTAVDPDLRQLFGLGPPLPAPDLSGEPSDTAWWRRLWHLHPAQAAEEAPAETLQRWIVDRDTIDAYLQAVRQVLDDVTKQALGSADLDERYRDVYRRLVLATAWLESCWRQFIRADGKVTYLKSAVGSIGMMQVNEHVWRGLYDLRGLRWDIRYNGRAGAEILMHYLQDYAIARNEDAQPGGVDNLARATYAVYNGGPGHLTRYRKKTTKRSLKRIDDLFWDKYRAVSNNETDVSRCLIGESSGDK
jgi:hypothetical protein